MEKKIMLGNEAFARGAYEAGVKVVSSYPGTPSTEVTENLAKCKGIHVEWAPNEKVGVEVAMGAVSYTHLDVYKRQRFFSLISCIWD